MEMEDVSNLKNVHEVFVGRRGQHLFGNRMRKVVLCQELQKMQLKTFLKSQHKKLR